MCEEENDVLRNVTTANSNGALDLDAGSESLAGTVLGLQMGALARLLSQPAKITAGSYQQRHGMAEKSDGWWVGGYARGVY